MNQNIVRTLTIRSKPEGFPETTAAMNKLKGAHEDLTKSTERTTKVTETSAKGQLSLQDGLARAERRFNATIRAQQDFEKVQRQINMAVAQNPALQARANDVLMHAREHFDKLTKSASVFENRGFFKMLAREAQLVGGPLGGMIGQFGLLSVGASRLSVGLVGGTIAISAMAAVVYKAIEAFMALESHQAKVAGALIVTKGASGQTVEGLERLTVELGSLGTHSVADIRAAQLSLLKFRDVGREAFGDVLRLAAAASATGFVDLKAATEAIARSMAEPAKAAEHLKDSGLSLSVAQQRLASDLYSTGQRAAAQRVIMQALSEQTAGADAKAADTLSAAFGRATNALTLQFEAIGSEIARVLQLKAAMNGLATATENAARAQRLENEAFESAIRIAQSGQLPGAKGDRLSGAGLGPSRRLADAMSQRGQMQPPFDAASWGDFLAAMVEAEKRLKGVIDALTEESRTAGMSAAQQKTFNEQVKAGVLSQEELTRGLLGTSEAARKVAAAVNAIEAKNFTRQTTDAMKTQAASAQIEAQTLGMSAGAAAEYRAAQEALAQARLKNIALSPEQVEAINNEAAAFGRVTQAAALAKVQAGIKFDQDTLLFSESDKQIAQQLVPIYGSVEAAMASAEAQQMRLNKTMFTMKDMALDIGAAFAKGIVSNLMQGKSVMDSMVLSARQLSQQLANQAITEAFKMNFAGAALSAAGALGFGLFGSKKTSEEQKAAFQAQVDMQRRWTVMNEETRIARLDQNSQEAELARFDLQAWQQRMDMIKEFGHIPIEVEANIAARREAILSDFAKQAVEREQEAERQRLATIEDFNRRFNEVSGKGWHAEISDLAELGEAA